MRGQSVLSLSHELIPGVVVDRFYQEANRLFDEAKQRFGVMSVAGSPNGYIDQETVSPEAPHNFARYQAAGRRAVDIVKDDPTISGIEVDSSVTRIQAVIREPLPCIPGRPNTYVKESFNFDDHLEFSYDLDTSDYALDGQEIISDRSGKGLSYRIAELLRDGPDGQTETPQEKEMRDELKAVYARAKEPRLEALRTDFPKEMAPYSLRCTDLHFNNVLKIIRDIKPGHEIGLTINPFVRADSSD